MAQISENIKSLNSISSKRGNVNLNVKILRKIYEDKRARFSLIFLLIFIFLGVFAPYIAPKNPEKLYYDALLQPPNKEFFLGTDALGRDILSRLLYGIRVTLTTSSIAVAITFISGTFIGVLSAYIGGWVDHIFMRIMDVLLALPSIILALAIVAVLGPSLTNAMIAIGISSIPAFARLTRSAALSIKSSGYVEASLSIGSSHTWIIMRQFLPNIMGVLVVYITLFIGGAILDTAALSFIGLGAQPPTPEWGTMLSDGKNYIYQAWWLATFPGIAITLVVFIVNILGDALIEIFDPKNNS